MNQLTKQLKRSYLILCAIIMGFLLLYIIQAVFIHKQSQRFRKEILVNYKMLSWINGLEKDIDRSDEIAERYLLGQDGITREAYQKSIAVAFEDIHKLGTTPITAKEQSLLNALRLVLREKGIVISKVATEGNIARSDLRRNSILELKDRTDKYLNDLRNVQTDEVKEYNDDIRVYNDTRDIFSVTSYIIISILLVITVYKINQNVRRRIVAEENARNTEYRYKTLVEDSGISILVINNAGTIEFANQNIYKLTGYTQDEIIGQPVIKGIARQFRSMIRQIIILLTRTGHYNNTFELQLATKQGVDKWVSCKTSPVGSVDKGIMQWQVMLWDIDEEKRIHLELEAVEQDRKKQQKLIQDIIDNIPTVIYLKDMQGRYLVVNKKMMEIYGLSADDVVGKTDAEIDQLKVGNHTNKADYPKDIFIGPVTEEEKVEIHGVEHYFLITRFPLFDEHGNVTSICGLATDITEQKGYEIRLLKAKKDADTARLAQEIFLANMSHEIRTPMNGIIGMTNLLLTTAINAEQKEFTENIQESSRHLLSIINDLLDFSKIKSGKFQLEYSYFKPRHVVRKAMYPLQFRAEEKLLALSVNIDNSVPDVLIGDPVRMQQILINLVGNAVKFTSHGSVDVEIYASEKTADTIKLHIEIEDTGIGIPQERLGYIFESFTQHSENTSRRYGGTGLGLAIVKQLVEMQGGIVSVKSELGKGSSFSVTIPYKYDNEAKVIDHKLGGIESHDNNILAGVRVLVAEDNIINQKVVKNTLSKQGAEVTLVINGQEAIEKVKNEQYDVVLMDLQMPEVDGYKATRYIRQVLHNSIPILAMTADALKGEAERCFEAGMTGFISKPFDPSDLYSQILRVTKEEKHNKTVERNNMNDQQAPLLDLSFLYDISDNDPDYIRDVIEIFLSTTPAGIDKLNQLLREGDDWDAIGKQAHFLKSSVSVIKIQGVYNWLASIEMNAEKEQDKAGALNALAGIVKVFNEALPLLQAEKEKNNQPSV